MTMMFGGYKPKVPEPEDPPPSPLDVKNEHERMVAWRRDHFEALGLNYPVALELAAAGVDWHRVARAMDGGCTPEQVEDIFL